MKIKSFLVVLMSVFTLATASAAPNKDKEGAKIVITEKASAQDAARARELQTRLDEIQAMDLNQLSHEEKVSLKREIKAMKKETKQMDGVYFYFGGGALILLIILLIILV